MNNLKDYEEYINEAKSVREIVRDLARRLSFDKDVIKFLNTSRAKRTMGWRELLQSKLHGNNLDYINYITKNMVADYNPQITGYINVKDEDEGDFDKEEEEKNKERKGVLGDDLDDIESRVEDIEYVLGIDPDDRDTIEIAKDKLGLNTDDSDDDENIVEEE
jgi:hypothetical protein